MSELAAWAAGAGDLLLWLLGVLWALAKGLLVWGSLGAILVGLFFTFHPIFLRFRLRASRAAQRGEAWIAHGFGLVRLGAVATRRTRLVILEIGPWRKILQRSPAAPRRSGRPPAAGAPPTPAAAPIDLPPFQPGPPTDVAPPGRSGPPDDAFRSPASDRPSPDAPPSSGPAASTSPRIPPAPTPLTPSAGPVRPPDTIAGDSYRLPPLGSSVPAAATHPTPDRALSSPSGRPTEERSDPAEVSASMASASDSAPPVGCEAEAEAADLPSGASVRHAEAGGPPAPPSSPPPPPLGFGPPPPSEEEEGPPAEGLLARWRKTLQQARQRARRLYRAAGQRLRQARAVWRRAWPILARAWANARGTFTHRQTRGRLRIGFPEPPLTGVFAGLFYQAQGMFFPPRTRIDLIPVFPGAALSGRIETDLRLNPWRLVYAGLAFLLDREVWSAGLDLWRWFRTSAHDSPFPSGADSGKMDSQNSGGRKG
ncbi:MAG: Vegetative cell wall protein gp1 precursor (Hydroxyproline-rich glycoprotein 1) [Candidatus Ozemobacter sibiricus]|jgi:hypothetical protein|uniref:Vegetative cell wall protein gp1 (Hydroxyproline-rich glycoprotein 1) n=1 Tax=Candidatus Ozemobacter sibiricus TaxID=2268124 RepID=A0A367ZT34_9BACT|nr:MAG: Vegetative cell wall protein gp1 precursor (Hydroxyproline-rich glycoprotein 1) [Candidatus Ozemobacter sibiricus]